MIKVSSIWLRRNEGYAHECVSEMVGSYADANSVLFRWSRTAPPKGERSGCHKTEFVVTFEDGEQYTGRYDLQSGAWVDIVQHMTDHLLFYTGTRCPAHMTETRYASFIEHTTSPEKRAAAVHFLATYELRQTPLETTTVSP